jgi:hypothetical protein
MFELGDAAADAVGRLPSGRWAAGTPVLLTASNDGAPARQQAA